MPEAPVLVRNATKGPVVFTAMDNPRNAFTWEAEGHPSGTDVQWIPHDVVITDPNFLRALDRGILVVAEASEDVAALIDHQVSAYHAQRGDSDAEAQRMLDHQQDSVVAYSEVVVEEGGKVSLKEQPIPVQPMDRQRQAPSAEPPLQQGPQQAAPVIVQPVS